jgi:hypothetical protein
LFGRSLKWSSGKSIGHDIKQGMLVVGSVFLLCVWLGIVFAGVTFVLSDTNRRPIVGWSALAFAIAAAFATMDRWVKIIPAVFAAGVLNGLLMFFTGHLTNIPTEPVSRASSAVMTILGIACMLMASRFLSRKLTLVDRIAILGMLISLLMGVGDEHLTLWSFTLMFVCLGMSWVYGRIRS